MAERGVESLFGGSAIVGNDMVELGQHRTPLRPDQIGAQEPAIGGHAAGKLISVLFACLREGELYDSIHHARELGLGDA